jgi:hypothetical protein
MRFTSVRRSEADRDAPREDAMPSLPPEYLDSKTPPDVIVTDVGRARIMDPTLGTSLGERPPDGAPPPQRPVNPLVTIGDSLTHGMSSAAVFHTDLSWPAQVARALALQPFNVPAYGGPLDGLPVNLEKLARLLEDKFGPDLSTWEMIRAAVALRSVLDKNEDYWERGAGATPRTDVRYHNLGIYGWDLRDTLSYDAGQAINNAKLQRDDFIALKPDHDNDIAAASVLVPFGIDATQISAAAWHGANGGIATLVVALGANNALGAVVSKEVNWSGSEFRSLVGKGVYNVWTPTHFAAEYAEVVRWLKTIPAQRVVLCTVPHVTIAPIARGVNPAKPGDKWQPGSRFFPYYTDPWIDDTHFRTDKHRYITHQQARAIDSAIDQYNDTIADAVRASRREGRDWFLLDMCGLLDSLAYRRYGDDPVAAERNHWVPYAMPEPIKDLNTRFFISTAAGRKQGGLFGLDGIHPTIVGYGILAQEVLRVLAEAGLPQWSIDFTQLLSADSLNSRPPAVIEQALGLLRQIAGLFLK